MVENLLSACATKHLLRFTTSRLPNRARAVSDPPRVSFHGSRRDPERRQPDVWSWTIRQPSASFLNTNEYRPPTVSLVRVSSHLPVTRATPGASSRTSTSANASLPISLPSAWYRFLYRSSVSCQPRVTSLPDTNVKSFEFQYPAMNPTRSPLFQAAT